jgi:hypothetical protein
MGKQMSDDVIRGLPADLASMLRDPDVFVPADAPVFALVASWMTAPQLTASAELVPSAASSLVAALYEQTRVASSTTVAAG